MCICCSVFIVWYWVVELLVFWVLCVVDCGLCVVCVVCSWGCVYVWCMVRRCCFVFLDWVLGCMCCECVCRCCWWDWVDFLMLLVDVCDFCLGLVSKVWYVSFYFWCLLFFVVIGDGFLFDDFRVIYWSLVVVCWWRWGWLFVCFLRWCLLWWCCCSCVWWVWCFWVFWSWVLFWCCECVLRERCWEMLDVCVCWGLLVLCGRFCVWWILCVFLCFFSFNCCFRCCVWRCRFELLWGRLEELV